LRITHPEDFEQLIFDSVVTAADYWQEPGSLGGQGGIGIALVLEKLAGAVAVVLDEDALA
jgi:hypothetical protein